MSDDPKDRQELEELLPWFATGTLSPAEERRIEAALARDPELSQRLSALRDEMLGTIQLNESLGAPSTDAIQKIFAKIEAEPARVRTSVGSLSARIAAFAAGLSPGTRFAMAAVAAIVIIAQAAVIGFGLVRNENATYVTASAPAALTEQGSFVLVRFAPQANAAKITELLETNRAVIENGPTTDGIYRVRVSQTVLAKDALSAIVKRMQRDPTISFIVASE